MANERLFLVNIELKKYTMLAKQLNWCWYRCLSEQNLSNFLNLDPSENNATILINENNLYELPSFKQLKRVIYEKILQ